MTSQHKQASGVEHDRQPHFEHVLSSGHYEGNPLLTEYRLLYDEYCRLQKHSMVLTKEKHNLETQLVEMNRSLDLASRIDPMTGLANRRDIMEKIEREYSRAERHHRLFSVLLADLDDFKLVNERYGYNSGDDVLVEVARVMMGCVRSEDVCARWGGEEFLFLLTETPLEGAKAVAQKINSSIAMTEFKAKKPGIRITVSIGVSEYQAGQSINDCISRADQALRTAKLEGKNRLVIG